MDSCCRECFIEMLCGWTWHMLVGTRADRQIAAYLNKLKQLSSCLKWAYLQSGHITLYHQLDPELYFSHHFLFMSWPPSLLVLAVLHLLYVCISSSTSSSSGRPSLNAVCFCFPKPVSSLWEIPLWKDNSQVHAAPCLPLCSLKRLPQLASFLMMRAECLLLSVLLSKQFPQRGLPPPDRLTQPGTQALLVEEKKRKRDLDAQWMHIYWV